MATLMKGVDSESAPPNAARDGRTFLPGQTDIFRLEQQQTRRLFLLGAAGLVAGILYLIRIAEAADPVHLFLGLGIVVLGAVPVFLWLREGGRHFPVFEVMLLTHIPVYAMPLIRGHERIDLFLPEIVTRAALVVLLFQATAIVTYRTVRPRPRTEPFWTGSVLSGNVIFHLLAGLSISMAYAVVAHFLIAIPLGLLGILRAAFFGISIICVFALCQAWGKGQLSPMGKTIVVANVAVIFFTSIRGLLLVEGTSLALLGFLAYIVAARRIPWIPALLFFLSIAVLHNGKFEMREAYWEDERAPPALAEMPGFLAEWIVHGITSDRVGRAEMPLSVAERTSLMHILCLVVDRTPYYKDYLYGETYGHIASQLVPRILWPEKPRGHVSTYRLAIYYGLQTEEGTQRTTIGFGLLPEAYANFGYAGAIALALLVGWFLRAITTWAQRSPLFSFPGLFLILLMAWSFRTELTMSIFISSLFQATAAVFALAFAVKKVLGRGNPDGSRSPSSGEARS